MTLDSYSNTVTLDATHIKINIAHHICTGQDQSINQLRFLTFYIDRFWSWAYRAAWAGSPPSLLGKQNQSGNIRFTVGQYWLIIKINGTNSVNFVGNSVNFVGNMLCNRNFS